MESMCGLEMDQRARDEVTLVAMWRAAKRSSPTPQARPAPGLWAQHAASTSVSHGANGERAGADLVWIAAAQGQEIVCRARRLILKQLKDELAQVGRTRCQLNVHKRVRALERRIQRLYRKV